MVETIVVYICVTLLVVGGIGILWCIFGLIRAEYTYKNQLVILDAVYEYQKWCITHGLEIKVEFDDVESFEDTFKRFWDFGYTRILPEDKFNMLKHFIENRRS